MLRSFQIICILIARRSSCIRRNFHSHPAGGPTFAMRINRIKNITFFQIRTTTYFLVDEFMQ